MDLADLRPVGLAKSTGIGYLLAYETSSVFLHLALRHLEKYTESTFQVYLHQNVQKYSKT